MTNQEFYARANELGMAIATARTFGGPEGHAVDAVQAAIRAAEAFLAEYPNGVGGNTITAVRELRAAIRLAS